MSKFKRNDKVKGIAGDIGGCEGIIVKVRDKGYSIKLTKIGNERWQSKWYIGMIEDRDNFWLNCLELISKGNKNPTHIILLNNDYYFVYGKEDRDKIVKELVDNKEVDNKDIVIYDIDNESKVKCKIKYLFFRKHHIEKTK